MNESGSTTMSHPYYGWVESILVKNYGMGNLFLFKEEGKFSLYRKLTDKEKMYWEGINSFNYRALFELSTPACRAEKGCPAGPDVFYFGNRGELLKEIKDGSISIDMADAIVEKEGFDQYVQIQDKIPTVDDADKMVRAISTLLTTSPLFSKCIFKYFLVDFG